MFCAKAQWRTIWQMLLFLCFSICFGVLTSNAASAWLLWNTLQSFQYFRPHQRTIKCHHLAGFSSLIVLSPPGNSDIFHTETGYMLLQQPMSVLILFPTLLERVNNLLYKHKYVKVRNLASQGAFVLGAIIIALSITHNSLCLIMITIWYWLPACEEFVLPASVLLTPMIYDSSIPLILPVFIHPSVTGTSGF